MHGAVVTLIVAIAMIYAYKSHQLADVLSAAERENISLARSFANSLSLEAENGFRDLGFVKHTEVMDRRLAALTQNLPVYKVKIFNPSGEALYSNAKK